jgi:predicted O-methyltransferase YrrM
MNWATVLDGVRGLNLAAVQIGLRRRQDAPSYISACVQQADAFLERGLPAADPIQYLRTVLGPEQHGTLCLPTYFQDGGGTRLEELVYLAAAARLLAPRKVFEIGTFKGRTAAVFALNAPNAEIVTLDLPPDYALDSSAYIESDAELVSGRNPVEFIDRYNVGARCRQVLVDSRDFDPGPHRGTVELAFIDGAHTYEYVRNDTEKTAVMMAERGLVFWHDYGGRGRMRGITDYLHELRARFPVYRISGTTLAWAAAADVRRLAGTDTAAESAAVAAINR